MIGFVAASLIGAATLQSETRVSIDASVAVFEAACLDIRGDRDAVRALAETHGWEAGHSELHPLMEWMDVYASGPAVLKLAYIPYKRQGDAFTPEQRICSVDSIDSDQHWAEKLSTIQVDGVALGAPGPMPDNYQLRPGEEMGVWMLRDESRIHGSYIPQWRRLEISINYPARYSPD